MTTPERVADVCALLGFRPESARYKEIAEIASRGWPPFRIAQWLDFPEEKWRALVGK